MISFPYTSVKTVSDGNVKYDRAIDSKIKRLYNQLRYTQGVAVDIGSGFQVVADTGMNVKVLCDGAWGHVGGDFCYESAASRTLSVQAPDSTYDRIDRVVLRNDISSKRAIDLYVVKGVPASTPKAPDLTNTPEVQEICLATLFISKNVNTISQDRISDTRLDKKVCGVLSNAFGEIDATQFFAQLEAQLKVQLEKQQDAFDEWLETIKGNLEGDPATALQLQIDKITSGATPVGKSTEAVTAQNANSFNGKTYSQLFHDEATTEYELPYKALDGRKIYRKVERIPKGDKRIIITKNKIWVWKPYEGVKEEITVYVATIKSWVANVRDVLTLNVMYTSGNADKDGTFWMPVGGVRNSTRFGGSVYANINAGTTVADIVLEMQERPLDDPEQDYAFVVEMEYTHKSGD